jgi:hypothetical protein
MRMSMKSKSSMPMHLRKAVRELLAAGGRVARDGNRLLVDGPVAPAEAVRAHAGELARYVIPSVKRRRRRARP